jgi:hypothetical protein
MAVRRDSTIDAAGADARTTRHRPLSGRVALVCALTLGACAIGCGSDDVDASIVETSSSLDASVHPSTYARQWMVNMQNSVKFDVISPPVAARTYAYGAIAMYEAVVHGMPGYQSLAGQLNGLSSLPQPSPGVEYDWPSVLAATMNKVVPATYVFPDRVFYEFITPAEATLKELGPAQIGYRRTSGVPDQVVDDSIAFGEALADALIAWANSDGYAEAEYKGWIDPVGPDKWVPTGFSDLDKVANPVEPWFGEIRPLVLTSSDECAAPPPVPFSTDPASAFYAEASAVHQTETTIGDQQREIAAFWADGPGATPTPAGHWVAITTKFVRSQPLSAAVEAYALVSIGFMDSFIASWNDKFKYNLLRPETYIRRHIQSDWRPLMPTPQFPSYTSGHSTQSSSSASLLTALFGSGPFTDDTKLRRGFGPRTFASFEAAAQEAGISRIYGGIHYPMDNSSGAFSGHCVADKILSRVVMAP